MLNSTTQDCSYVVVLDADWHNLKVGSFKFIIGGNSLSVRLNLIELQELHLNGIGEDVVQFGTRPRPNNTNIDTIA